MSSRGWGVVVTAGVVAGLMVGCSGGPEPVVTPTPTPAPIEALIESPSPSPSPTPAELTEDEILAAIPQATAGEDFWTAQEFSRFFLENYHQMMQTAPEQFGLLTSPACGFCLNVKEAYADAESRGNWLEGGHVVVTDQLAKGGLQEDGTWGVILSVDATDMAERDRQGQVVESFEGGPGEARLLLEFNGHWTVLELSAAKS